MPKPEMFITAAPVGAVPKYLDPRLPRFFPSEILDISYTKTDKKRILKDITDAGWECVSQGGLTVKIGHGQKIDSSIISKLPQS